MRRIIDCTKHYCQRETYLRSLRQQCNVMQFNIYLAHLECVYTNGAL